ncbi:hypothetical protein PV11_01544 [Exophiala sideris]|uniref:Exonuclease domain-containing protein n=1 Tax=Exophiala sideris TaxID=1016849 RepID=A0A0D1YTE7_9EURO|nr:hypothetical protein PV11_01544 [Exophiala sideris]
MSSNIIDTRFSGEITSTSDHHEALVALCHNDATLIARQYDLVAAPASRIERKLRCSKCVERVSRPLMGEQVEQKDFVCFYHSGRLANRFWTCCNNPIKTLGCVRKHSHTIPPKNDPSLQEDWQYYHTPAEVVTQVKQGGGRGRKKQKKWVPFVEHHSPYSYRKAIVLDCEMGTSSMLWRELIRLSAVDYYTGETLIDSLVRPSVPMRNLSTSWSGVSWADMRQAERTGTCILGRDEAREALWKFVSPETIVITHAGENDLNALRWIHPRVVDTQILYGGRSGLATLSSSILGLEIQTGNGHCSLEDAMATRELASRYVKRQMAVNNSSDFIDTPVVEDLTYSEEKTGAGHENDAGSDMLDDEYDGEEHGW